MHVKFRTRATRIALRDLIRRRFDGSQLEFSHHCGLDPADTSRVITGTRSASVELVGRVMTAVGETEGAELLAAFLSDVLLALPRSYHVVAVPLPRDQAEKSVAR